ncbi:hypothetical protein CFP65_3367 [Kitasatospora sp. MMS16-BH015]|uniref:hypothetical protein n=1 Tax=Kitasatospora sp. MMS16-BH015 TaxID=2018025 RepID=UPI000CA37B1D|nr:hypothetical protein [Kitasatospora sp. MMS16-BH015]AUG78163.1 hypothetical protein CFP65_3367 [Kitasatospora sp. MMS16-BH015]
MSTNRSRRIDRATAERLLDGSVADTSGGPAALADNAALAGLLAAAAAPAAGPAELPGEEQALTAFRQARRTPAPAPAPRRRRMASTAPARALSAKSAKALLAALALTALGGVAVAASTGNLGALPSMLGRGSGGDLVPVAAPPASSDSAHGAATPSRPGGTGTRSEGPGIAAKPTPAAPAPHSSAAPGHPDQPNGSASPSTRPEDGPATARDADLCRTFEERESAGAKPKQILTDPALAPLVKSAEGAEHVDAYCTTLLGKPKDHGPTAEPTHKDPGGAPTKADHDHPATDLPARSLPSQAAQLAQGAVGTATGAVDAVGGAVTGAVGAVGAVGTEIRTTLPAQVPQLNQALTGLLPLPGRPGSLLTPTTGPAPLLPGGVLVG